MIAVDWQNITASADLLNIYNLAKSERLGNWRIAFNGLFIYCHDLLSFYMAAKDIFLKQIYKSTSTQPAPRIIDGGGHIGLFTLYVKQHFPQAQITIFEPDAESLELLGLNLKINNIADVEIVEAGLFSEERNLLFAGGQSDGSTIFSSQTNVTIRTVKLSNYIHNTIDFMKLNIEGAEFCVLEDVQPKLHLVNELVIEYHGFPKIGQNLHKILHILDTSGFRYLIHDFDEETNPATKPPFHVEINSQFFLLIYARQLFTTNHADSKFSRHDLTSAAHDVTPIRRPSLGDLERLHPISRVFGGDRMTETSLPLCWFYIRRFLSDHVNRVAGRVLEIGDNIYTKMFGGDRVTQSDILHVTTDNSAATIIGDLTKADNILSNTYDCVICTQTLHVIYDIKTALQNLYRILKPGGVLLASLPGISQISRYDMDRWGDYWRFTTASVQRLFSELWPENDMEIKSFGNVLTSVAYLHGLVSGEIPKEALGYNDNDYQMLICVYARKPLHPAENTTVDKIDEVKLISNGWNNYAATWAAETFKVLPGESVAYLGDEWTAEDVSGGGTTYGLDAAIVRNFTEYFVHQLLDPYLPRFADVALEIGPGGGRITELLKTRTGLLHVADASEAMLAKLKDRFALDHNLIYHFTDGINLPVLSAESLDYVIAFDVFVHFEPRLVYWYLKQIANFLKPDGTGIIHYANLTTSIGWQQFESDVEINVRRRTHFASFGTMCPEIMRMFLVSLDLKILSVDIGLIPRDAVAVFKK